MGGGVVVAAQPFAAGAQSRTASHPAAGEASCVLQGPGGPVRHVISITFDNVHLSRDDANVPSDIEQIPALKSFITQNGALLSNELPSGLHGDANVDAFLQLGETYKQLDAGVGEFGMDTLEASTIGLESSNPSTYSSTESALSSLGARRDALAATIEGDLEDVEFGGGALATSTAQSLTSQAQHLINQAAALA